MSVSVASVAPATFTALGGSLTITGVFELAESPFAVFAEHVDTLDLVELSASVTSPDETTIVVTVPADLTPGVYGISVTGQLTGSAFPNEEIEVTGETIGVTGVSPATLTADGGTLTVEGLFELGQEYGARLEGTGDDVDIPGPVTSEDGTTLVFEVAALPEGAYLLYVFPYIDASPGDDIEGSASLSVTMSTLAVTAAARGSSAILTGFGSFVPHFYCGLQPLAAGMAAVLALTESAADDLREQATIGLATDIWLTLAARGQGILRATAEEDDVLRSRMRAVDAQVTPAAIVDAVDTILAPDECVLIEWWEHSYLDVEIEDEGGLWLDTERLSGGPSSFLVLVPERGWLTSGSFVDSTTWLDTVYLGTEAESGYYAAIINAVNRCRAAGVFWRLCLI